MVRFWLARPTRTLTDCGQRLADIEGADVAVPHSLMTLAPPDGTRGRGRTRTQPTTRGRSAQARSISSAHLMRAGERQAQQHRERNDSPGTKSVPHITGGKSAALETLEARCANVPRGVLASNFVCCKDGHLVAAPPPITSASPVPTIADSWDAHRPRYEAQMTELKGWLHRLPRPDVPPLRHGSHPCVAPP